ncbi:MAG: global cell cycle regulator GcrA-like protein [Parcubacteria group bacterium]|nr:global cell cycle regulator GcrA-like protein [Parcubacteria group bacterium]
MAFKWTDERVAKLEMCWADKDYSAARIAKEMRKETGEQLSREAVAGKANRLGLSKPTKSSVTRQQRQEERTEKVLELQPPADQGATIFSLTARTCRWPIGDPRDTDFHFCGADSKTGQPYCDYHAAMAYRPPKAKGGDGAEEEADHVHVPKGGPLTNHLPNS